MMGRRGDYWSGLKWRLRENEEKEFESEIVMTEKDLKDILEKLFKVDKKYIVPIKNHCSLDIPQHDLDREFQNGATYIGYEILSKKIVAGRGKTGFRLVFAGDSAEDFADSTLYWKSSSAILDFFKDYKIVFRNLNASEISSRLVENIGIIWFADFTVERFHEVTELSSQEEKIASIIEEYLDKFVTKEITLSETEVGSWPLVYKMFCEEMSWNEERPGSKLISGRFSSLDSQSIRRAMKTVKKYRFVQLDDDESREFRILYKSGKSAMDIINES